MDGFRVFCSPQKKKYMETNEYLKYMEINSIPYTIDTSPNQETIGKIKVIK